MAKNSAVQYKVTGVHLGPPLHSYLMRLRSWVIELWLQRASRFQKELMFNVLKYKKVEGLFKDWALGGVVIVICI